MRTLMIISITLLTALFGCKKEEVVAPAQDITSQINTFPKEPLTADEIQSLKWMREEEKLAHDVYITLYNTWTVNIFTNIASSEQMHTDAVLTLLQKYELPDPVGANAVGVFTDTTLQNLYVQLVNQGNTSILEAFKLGATIEDLDIYDLNQWLTKVDNQDLLFVYNNLNKGSRNHMRSFYSQIISAGGTYTAQFITQAELDAILNTPKEKGGW